MPFRPMKIRVAHRWCQLLDEVVNQRVQTAVRILTMLLAAVLFHGSVQQYPVIQSVSRPIHGTGEGNADLKRRRGIFLYSGGGTKEVVELSQSFEHMVGQIRS